MSRKTIFILFSASIFILFLLQWDTGASQMDSPTLLKVFSSMGYLVKVLFIGSLRATTSYSAILLTSVPLLKLLSGELCLVFFI